MSLIIDDEDTCELVHELAGLTGESPADAVDAAVRERLVGVRQLQGVGLTDRLLEIGADAARRLPDQSRGVEHTDGLYDERGLPG
ncbi:type II toxin-antitoxin system VapB family antitoxin [Kribbella sp. NPDC058245]|uniref:type II toxin-antitoxin system VapB family antitoxin n=1 Tax=Kribbella sp. NPDC058245 TaxID=3346399 RepID=UPI0036E2AA37